VKVVCFDTETTGLVENRTRALERQPEIIEFYGCVASLVTGKVSYEVDVLIKPSTMPLEEHTTKITGIKTEDLTEAPSFGEIAPQIEDLFSRAKVAIAHNATFDRDMLEIEYQRLGRVLTLPSRLLCTVEQTNHIKGHRLSLSALHEHLFGEVFSGAHRAKEDVRALLRCAVELRKRDML